MCLLFLTLALSWASLLNDVQQQTQVLTTTGQSSLLRDAELQHHVLTTTRQSSLMDCSAACLTDMCCLSFNFFQPTLECQLNYKTKDQSPNDFVQKKGSFYRNKDTIPESVSGVCAINVCRSYEVCRVRRGATEGECIPRETGVTALPRVSVSGKAAERENTQTDM
ncbi:uncharacterized protein LOC121387586 [Gigantopelta aegis]|uniref:uncharacterized protein LOC121387586 n=1 Tax=Gigantopelta aegis TaxID=1735272 RepID=UPI001B88C7C8|nr:uncharacterized protein LOC121387586 [Gigantopelta aegis]